MLDNVLEIEAFGRVLRAEAEADQVGKTPVWVSASLRLDERLGEHYGCCLGRSVQGEPHPGVLCKLCGLLDQGRRRVACKEARDRRSRGQRIRVHLHTMERGLRATLRWVRGMLCLEHTLYEKIPQKATCDNPEAAKTFYRQSGYKNRYRPGNRVNGQRRASRGGVHQTQNRIQMMPPEHSRAARLAAKQP